MTVTELSIAGEQRLETGCSTEEADHLIRSTKKIKSTADSKDETMNESILEPEILEGVSPVCHVDDLAAVEVNQNQITEICPDSVDIKMSPSGNRSFKQALLRSRFNENGNEKNFDCDVEVLSSDEEDDNTDEPMEERGKDGIDNHSGIPIIRIPPALLKKVREPWKKCLILRLLGKTIRYKLFMLKMSKIWGLQVDFEALDIGNGFFIVKFDMVEDYTKSDDAEEDTTAIWVRFPNLPIEYYNEKVLFHIAKALGVPLKVDINTTMAARGKYARVCVEINLRKPLISHFTIGKYTYGVEYEHLHSLCFSCGRVGHRQESCSDRQPPASVTQPQDRTGNTIEKTIDQMGKSLNPDQERTDSELGRPTYGPWMTVTNQRRKNKGSLTNRGNKAQMGNKFHGLREKGGPVKDHGQTSRINEDLGFRYKTNNRPIVENISHSSLATAKANNGEDIRLGSEVQNLQIRHQNSNSNTVAQMSNSIPSTHSGTPSPTTTEDTLL
ncbi:hypothetical protein ACSBR2_001014 [Camellia fascicularis]